MTYLYILWSYAWSSFHIEAKCHVVEVRLQHVATETVVRVVKGMERTGGYAISFALSTAKYIICMIYIVMSWSSFLCCYYTLATFLWCRDNRWPGIWYWYIGQQIKATWRKCVSVITAFIGSDNGFTLVRCQAIVWSNDGLLLNEPLRKELIEILIKSYKSLFVTMRSKMPSARWRSFCLGLNMSYRLVTRFAWNVTFLDLVAYMHRLIIGLDTVVGYSVPTHCLSQYLLITNMKQILDVFIEILLSVS